MCKCRGILQIALDVHMTTSGSYERSNILQEKDIAILKNKLENWEPSLLNSRFFDECVRNLIESVVLEAIYP